MSDEFDRYHDDARRGVCAHSDQSTRAIDHRCALHHVVGIEVGQTQLEHLVLVVGDHAQSVGSLGEHDHFLAELYGAGIGDRIEGLIGGGGEDEQGDRSPVIDVHDVGFVNTPIGETYRDPLTVADRERRGDEEWTIVHEHGHWSFVALGDTNARDIDVVTRESNHVSRVRVTVGRPGDDQQRRHDSDADEQRRGDDTAPGGLEWWFGIGGRGRGRADFGWMTPQSLVGGEWGLGNLGQRFRRRIIRCRIVIGAHEYRRLVKFFPQVFAGRPPATINRYHRSVHSEKNADHWFALTPDPLAVGDVYEWAVRGDCGAVVLFSGTVRDHAEENGERRDGVTHLDYEAYDEKVLPSFRAIADEVRVRWPAVGRIALLHRVGRLELGESSVLAVVSAPHRPEAFAAARFAIDALKSGSPIWKREEWSGGSAWGTGASVITEPSHVASLDESGAR